MNYILWCHRYFFRLVQDTIRSSVVLIDTGKKVRGTITGYNAVVKGGESGHFIRDKSSLSGGRQSIGTHLRLAVA